MLEKNELYKALEAAAGIPVISESFQCFKNEAYHEQFNGINLSHLFTLLIRETVKYTESYTSDIFYDLQKLWSDLKGDTTILYNQSEYKNVIAIRDMGTDGESFILTRNAGESDTFEYLYKTIFYIKVTPDKRSESWKTLECFRVDPKELDTYFQKKQVI